MAIGDVFYFNSTKVVGYETRNKYHIFLGKTDNFRAPAEYCFLLISSADYGNCFPISFADYGEFLTHDSFISCSNMVFYNSDELREEKPKLVGSIRTDHLVDLRNHLADHEVMENWQIAVACKALAVFV